MHTNPVRSVLDFLAKMGLSIRDDPPKVIELEGREWGPETDGFALSVSAEPAVASVVLRNIGHAPRILQAPEFVNWFLLEVTPAARTAYGERLLRTGGGKGATRPLELGPGQAVEAQIPIESIFHLTAGSVYQVRASCAISADRTVVSNYARLST